MIEEVRASAHCAHTMSRLSVGYKKMAVEFPKHRERYLAESRRLRQLGIWSLERARRLRERVE